MYEEWEDDQYEIALRAELDQPCPSCELPNRLTRADALRSLVCDGCADRAERGTD